jgi:formylglycine-generating enzyme
MRAKLSITSLMIIALSLLSNCSRQKEKAIVPDNTGLLKRHQIIEQQIDSFIQTLTISAKDSVELYNGMVLIKGGTFSRGYSDPSMPDAQPVHKVTLDDFCLDETPVTNAQFAEFANDTGYKTVAERPINPKDFPGIDVTNMMAGSIVFHKPVQPVALNDPSQWWRYIAGANWRHPEGPESSLEGKADHPVVHICWEDAMAYCHWAGKRLPTEAEFEYAARGGLEAKLFAWGDKLLVDGRWMANIWQGNFPAENTHEDGFELTSPVRAFPPNAYGLYDVSGNVWQWCSDWYHYTYYEELVRANKAINNPTGPLWSHDPFESGLLKKVQRSGSFLCSDLYCIRYLVGSRGKGEIRSASSNTGFRCAR